MSLFITSLNSGSNGNCYYVANDHEAVLVDVGISCRETEKRMLRLGLSMQKVKAIFISHEHSDHIKGLEVLAKKYQLPVYITDATLNNSRLNLCGLPVFTFKSSQPITVGDLTVIPFSKFHDAADPYSFVVNGNNINIGVFTDIGHCCEQVVSHFKLCHAVFLEANYDEQMLTQGVYPHHLKQRIRSNRGHLSNMQALELFKNHRPDFMKLVILSHLSKDNNCPVLVNDLFTTHAEHTKVVVASRHQETEVFHITPSFEHTQLAGHRVKVITSKQTTLF
ncbi:MAG: MBL fold metallo-hydrolase [Bacteroidetes bacterium]|nr:MBL fold metallo-hydrolase [Bacteroidota bacterium]